MKTEYARPFTPSRPEPLWLARPEVRSNALARLICLPFAGGGPSSFRSWLDFLPEGIELCAVQPPGRERRLLESPCRRMAHLVSEAVDSLQQEQALDIEFVLFGHSLGGKVAFEIARELRRRRMRGPSLLIVSGARAPHIAEADLHFRELPDAEFLRSLNGKVGGLPEGILDNHELRQFLLPTLRADLEVLDTYLHEPEPPLDCPISCFGGSRDDRVPIESLAAWMDHTTGHFRLRTFQGGHFFLQERPDAFREALLSELREVVGAG